MGTSRTNAFAYPMPVAVTPAGDSFSAADLHSDYSGMTLRERFAESAMIALIGQVPHAEMDHAIREVVKTAYEYADAMIEASQISPMRTNEGTEK